MTDARIVITEYLIDNVNQNSEKPLYEGDSENMDLIQHLKDLAEAKHDDLSVAIDAINYIEFLQERLTCYCSAITSAIECIDADDVIGAYNILKGQQDVE